MARTCCRKLRNIGSAAGRPADGGVDDAIDPPLPIATSLEEVCDPRRLALLIYDMQVGICQQVSCGPTITEACKRLRDRCRAAGVPVAYSRHLLLPAHWMGPFQTPRAMAWQRVDAPDAVKPWFLRGAQGFQLVPDLAPTEDEFVFDKLGMSAFEGTPLQFALRESRHHNPGDLRYRIGDRQGIGPGR